MSEIDFSPLSEGLELVGGIKILPKKAAKQDKKQTGFFDRPLGMGMMNFSVLIESNGFMADVIRTFDLDRLNRIRQLQSLTYLYVDNNSRRLPNSDHIFPHSRLLPHSVLCGTLRALIAKHIQKADPTETRLAILEDLIHDAMTVAGGDAWRNIDLPKPKLKRLRQTLFNEDSRIIDIFEQRRGKWRVLREKYGLPKDTPERAAKAINQEQGLDGALHTFTDTLSYLASDVDALRSLYQENKLRFPNRLRPILELATPEIFNLWQNLSVSGQKIVVKTPDVLHRFLKLRLTMYKEIYTHPGHKIIELLLSNLVYPDLWKRLVNEPDLLLQINDDELDVIIQKVTQIKNLSRRLDAFGMAPRLMIAENKKDALWLEEQYAKRGHLTLLIDCCQFVKTKTKSSKYFVEGPDSRPIAFAKAFPKAARELSLEAKKLPNNSRFHLAVFERAALTASFEKIWQKARKRWH